MVIMLPTGYASVSESTQNLKSPVRNGLIRLKHRRVPSGNTRIGNPDCISCDIRSIITITAVLVTPQPPTHKKRKDKQK